MGALTFVSDARSIETEDALVLTVPPLGSREALVSWYSHALSFPAYFSGNWDSFEECLRDLSWIAQRRVVVYHESVPLGGASRDQRIYLDILKEALEGWSDEDDHELIAAFHASSELPVRTVTS